MIKINAINPTENDISSVKLVSEKAFSTTPDSSLEEWFSFEEMQQNLKISRGICLMAEDESKNPVGMIYAQQESPINGKEGREKWVIVIAAVIPEATGKGVGKQLLSEIEKQVKQQGGIKLFTYTNKEDEKAINFYKKNGYEDAGWIKDYQYGKDNSAVFLLKYLKD